MDPFYRPEEIGDRKAWDNAVLWPDGRAVKDVCGRNLECYAHIVFEAVPDRGLSRSEIDARIEAEYSDSITYDPYAAAQAFAGGNNIWSFQPGLRSDIAMALIPPNVVMLAKELMKEYDDIFILATCKEYPEDYFLCVDPEGQPRRVYARWGAVHEEESEKLIPAVARVRWFARSFAGDSGVRGSFVWFAISGAFSLYMVPLYFVTMYEAAGEAELGVVGFIFLAIIGAIMFGGLGPIWFVHYTTLLLKWHRAYQHVKSTYPQYLPYV